MEEIIKLLFNGVLWIFFGVVVMGLFGWLVLCWKIDIDYVVNMFQVINEV